jgi:hypothetical protein
MVTTGGIFMNSSKRFRRLLEPGYIGAIRTRNRLLKTGSTLGFYPWEDGHIQQKVIDSYEVLAKGGAGIVTVGAAPLGVPPGRGYKMDDDKYLPSMTKLAEAIRKHDCPAFLQTFHLGPMLPPHLAASGVQALAASSLSKSELPLPHLAVTKELTVAEIEGIVEAFGDQVERAKRAGFQGIELNAGCNHLLNSFLSRAWEIAELIMRTGSRVTRRITTQILRKPWKEDIANELRHSFSTEMYVTATEHSPHEVNYWHWAHEEAELVRKAEKKGKVIRPRVNGGQEEDEIK